MSPSSPGQGIRPTAKARFGRPGALTGRPTVIPRVRSSECWAVRAGRGCRAWSIVLPVRLPVAAKAVVEVVVQDEIQLLLHELVVPRQHRVYFVEEDSGLANPNGIRAPSSRLRGASYLGKQNPRQTTLGAKRPARRPRSTRQRQHPGHCFTGNLRRQRFLNSIALPACCRGASAPDWPRITP